MCERNGKSLHPMKFVLRCINFLHSSFFYEVFVILFFYRASLVATPSSARYQDALAFTRSLGDLHLQTYGMLELLTAMIFVFSC